MVASCNCTSGHELDGLRILVVEDWLPLARELRYQLLTAGAQVVGPAGNLTKAMQFAECELIDAALLDIDLNGQRVFPVAELLLERGIPFVFVTAYDTIEIPEELQSAPLVAKPAPFPVLSEIISKAIHDAGT